MKKVYKTDSVFETSTFAKDYAGWAPLLNKLRLRLEALRKLDACLVADWGPGLTLKQLLTRPACDRLKERLPVHQKDSTPVARFPLGANMWAFLFGHAEPI